MESLAFDNLASGWNASGIQHQGESSWRCRFSCCSLGCEGLEAETLLLAVVSVEEGGGSATDFPEPLGSEQTGLANRLSTVRLGCVAVEVRIEQRQIARGAADSTPV